MTTTTETAITTRTIRRGARGTHPLVKSLSLPRFVPFDIFIFDKYDRLVTSDVPRLFWKMVETSNGGFYIYPDSAVKEVSMACPFGNDYSCKVSLQISGLIATLLFLSHLTFQPEGCDAAVYISDALKEYRYAPGGAPYLRND
jgi:hypothetical protein